MDEVAYWVSTKRAPCLMTYDQQVLGKKSSTVSAENNVDGAAYHPQTLTPKKNNKRKLAILDDESVASAKAPNVYFEVPGEPKQAHKCKVQSISDSDVDFNIKDSPVQTKPKRLKFQNAKGRTQKKSKLISSTPKGAINLRRSPRKTVNNNISLWETNFSTYGCKNGINLDCVLNDKSSHTLVKTKRNLTFGSQDQLKNTSPVEEKHLVKANHNPYDDESDVSGFTANYIRSTKVNSKGQQRKLPRGKKKHLTNTDQKDDSLLICYNKSVNTVGLPGDNRNNSTDSSQNVISLVSKTNGESPMKVSRDTSLLKFMEPKISKIEEAKCKHFVNQSSKTDMNISSQSKGSRNSRYPQRKVKHDERLKKLNNSSIIESPCKNEVSQREEVRLNDDSMLTGVTTRSGRALRPRVSPTDQNVGEDSYEQTHVKNKQISLVSSKNVSQIKTPTNKSKQSKKRESFRDKSGFTACFSDSDGDSDSDTKQKKFFC